MAPSRLPIRVLMLHVASQRNVTRGMVEDPAQLANIRKGDQVEAVYAEALAISVEPAVKK
ncbi:hypothetical protein [Paraburkholderia hospita]|nr:hypothetical protein [Paraburkholderia hospita]